MHNKNNNKTHTYIQGLRPFSSSIPKTLKKHLRKGGYNYSNIVDNWTRMVSKKISDKCYPNSITSEKGGKGATLVLNVIHGKEMEVEYIKNDIISKIKENFKTPVFAYQVSGEYSAIKFAIKNGILDEESMIESVMAFKRAGACAIVTYFAMEIAKNIQSSK